MKKIILIFCFLSAFVNAQITQLDQWKTKGNTFTTNTNYLGTNNSRSLVIKTNSVQVGKIDSVGKWTIGTGTVAANTSSLGIVRIKQGSSWIDFGSHTSGLASIWFGVIPSSVNYGFLGDGSTTYLNATSRIYFSMSNSAVANLSSTGLRIGDTTLATAKLDVVGNFITSGTSTLTGIVNTSSLASTSSLYFNAATGNEVFFQTNGTNRGRINASYSSFVTPMRIGSVSAPNTAATLDVSGTMSVSSTMTLGTAGLTGGNTGTVAVLSDVVWNSIFSGYNNNPLDLDVRYMGLTTHKGYNATNQRIRVPVNCVLTGWNYSAICLSAIGSAETTTMSIRVNNTTDYLLSASITYSASYQDFSASGLSISLTAGDLISIKFQSPTFATNPTTITDGISLDFKQR